MKKLFMLGMCALAMSLVGCSKASKYESILRETGKVGGEAVIKRAIKELKSFSPEKQDKKLAELKERIKEMKKEQK